MLTLSSMENLIVHCNLLSRHIFWSFYIVVLKYMFFALLLLCVT